MHMYKNFGFKCQLYFKSILELLPLSDLCSMSSTCKYIQSLAQRENRRKNPNELITIEINRRSAFEGESKLANDNYVDVELLYNFMKSNCCESLNSLSINILSSVNINVNIHPDEYVKKQLRSVQSLTIEKLKSVSAV